MFTTIIKAPCDKLYQNFIMATWIKVILQYISADLSPVLCFRCLSKKGTDPFLGRPGACELNAGDDTLRDICCDGGGWIVTCAVPFSFCNGECNSLFIFLCKITTSGLKTGNFLYYEYHNNGIHSGALSFPKLDLRGIDCDRVGPPRLSLLTAFQVISQFSYRI